MKNFLPFVFSVLAAFLLGFLAGRGPGGSVAASGERTDTLRIVRTDTLRIDRPVLLSRTVRDTVYLRGDTVRVRDSVFVALPLEERVYSDSLYRARVSGIHPSLDWIEVYPRTERTVVTTRERVSRWSVGPAIGVSWDGRRISPSAGISLQYALWRPGHGKDCR